MPTSLFLVMNIYMEVAQEVYREVTEHRQKGERVVDGGPVKKKAKLRERAPW